MAKRKKISRRAQPKTAWQALNAPIAYPSEEFARTVFLLTAIIMLLVWLMPYWSQSQIYADTTRIYADLTRTDADLTRTYADSWVASAQTGNNVAPEWYYTASRASSDVVNSFGVAAEEVLDISEQVAPMAEFYQPGVSAVWGAWLELMADPEF